MIDQKTLDTLGYNDIKTAIKRYTSSQLGKTLVDNMMPQTEPAVVLKLYDEAKEAKAILEEGTGLSLGGINDITPFVQKADKGVVLQPEELLKVADFMRCIRNLKKSLEKYQYTAPLLYSYALGLESFKSVEADIEYCIDGSIVHSRASHTLQKVRQRINVLHSSRIEKLNKFLSSDRNAKHIQELYYSQRDGRYVIPIKAASRKFVEGTVIGASSSGSTVYIEIESIKDLTVEIIMLESQEREECYQILKRLTQSILEHHDAIVAAIQIVGKYDFIMAKGKYTIAIGGYPIDITDNEIIHLKKARHPMLGETAVPLDVNVGNDYRSLIITGPNTGGKTLTLKTVGLMVLMTQSGILPPVAAGSKISLFNKVLVDIGDSQSIEQSLSTFSGHMQSLVDIIRRSSRRTLILIDEIGTGTDPKDGAALGIAILETIYNRGAITLSSTHYSKIKEYSELHPGFMNASMDFDRTTLKPLYKLLIGVSGDSNALWISKELGLPDKVLDRAREINSTHEHVAARQISQFSKKKDRVATLRVPKPITRSEAEVYHQGDLVILNESSEKWLVYAHDEAQHVLTVFKDGQYLDVGDRRVTLHQRAEMLYPEGYDMAQLFVDFKTRKLEKDMKKGRFKDLSELNERLNALK
ncbi:endonuclease MutS2 [Fusibacter paucivorans]|uniref:Endonuclease MutS2 n=1 Tax=Fusibacter paucivorans TaxID=76009 RepID=A0ABS5PSW6_9FIRM|nr:endonuclease MutS2 [Fusibacter paucivorans]MBS7528264.1 endonuclease MutS2 [Fusibacter paucivorans]